MIYLFTGKIDFPSHVTRAIEENDCYISPMVRLELQYLFEVGRAKVSSGQVIDALYKEIGLVVHNHPFDSIVLNAFDAPWTRDPFDRLVTAHAKTLSASLITRDHTILAHYEKSFWEKEI